MFVSGPPSGAPVTGDGAAGGYRPEVLHALWESVPAGMRATCFGPDTVPGEYRGGLGEKRGRSTPLDLSALPEPIRTELAWCVFRIIDQGGRVDIGHMRMLVRRLSDAISDLGPHAPASLTGLSGRDWEHQMARASQRRAGVLPAPGTASDLRQQLRRCLRLLSVAYDPRPWWQREVWDPGIDPRIPQRLHEPRGRHARHFDRIAIGWLRRGLQWYCKVGLETGGLSWGTVQLRIDSALVFDAFLAGRDVPGPWLADEPDQVRALLLDFLGHVRGLRVQQPGPTHGQPLSQSRVSTLLGGVEQFYLFMHDHRETAATSLAEPGWLRLGVAHAVLFRRGDKPRRSRHRGQGRDVIDADAFTQIMAGAGLLGTPAAEGGLGDEQAMRILMLLARTGRRVSEICMLDHDPLLPLHQPASSAGDAQGEAEGSLPGSATSKPRSMALPTPSWSTKRSSRSSGPNMTGCVGPAPTQRRRNTCSWRRGTTAMATGPTRMGGCASGSANWPAGSISATPPACWWTSSAPTASATPSTTVAVAR